MYCFLFFHFDHKFPQVSAGSSSKPWMPLDSQQPNSHCYWLTTYSELLCVCSHSHLYWYETAQTPELGKAGHRQSGCRGQAGRQAVRQILQVLASSFCHSKSSCSEEILYWASIEALTTWNWKCSSSFQSLFRRSSNNPGFCMHSVHFLKNLPVCFFAITTTFG